MCARWTCLAHHSAILTAFLDMDGSEFASGPQGSAVAGHWGSLWLCGLRTGWRTRHRGASCVGLGAGPRGV